jgi:hypothetical protein
VIGTFLYYGQAVDPTMLTTLSAIVSTQAKPTKETMIKTHDILDYATTHQDAIIAYPASNMVLAIHSDALYLSEPKTRSQVGGNFFHAVRHQGPWQQWCSFEHRIDHQICDIISCQSRTRRTLC